MPPLEAQYTAQRQREIIHAWRTPSNPQFSPPESSNPFTNPQIRDLGFAPDQLDQPLTSLRRRRWASLPISFRGCAWRRPIRRYQQLYQQQQQQNQQLQLFWQDQYREIENTTDFKNHNLPLARIKKIMKADEDVRMIAAEAPVVFARAGEMFILELTHCSWSHAEENKRRTLQKNDITAAITRTDVFDFLVDIVPREEGREEVVLRAALRAPAADPLAYYYRQQ